MVKSELERITRMAVAQNDPMAQFNLGFMYNNGFGVKKDFNVAIKWYQLAAEQGYSVAQFNLGGMYAAGRGVPRDDAKAAEWHRKAARSA